jgi:hypothetical protein
MNLSPTLIIGFRGAPKVRVRQILRPNMDAGQNLGRCRIAASLGKRDFREVRVAGVAGAHPLHLEVNIARVFN